MTFASGGPQDRKRWVDAQKDSIIAALGGRDPALAHALIDELVRAQRADGRSDLAAKSLCDLAKRAERIGAFEHASTWLEEARTLAPEDPIVWAQLVELMRAQRRPGERLAWSERMIARLPNDPLALTTRASTLHATGQLAEALEAYDRAVAVDQRCVHAWTGRSAVRRSLGQLAEAEAEFEEATHVFPDDPVVWAGFAGVVRDRGHLSRAVLVYQRGIARLPNNARLCVGLGELMLALGRPDEALALLEEAQRRDPADLSGARGRAKVLVAMGRRADARAVADGVAPRDRGGVVARVMRGEVAKDGNQLEEAVLHFRKVLGQGRLDAAARTAFALTTMRLGRIWEAERILRTAAAESYDRPATAGRWAVRLARSLLSVRRRGTAIDAVGLEAVRSCPFVETAARAAHAIALSAIVRGALEEATKALAGAPRVEAAAVTSTRRILGAVAARDRSAFAEAVARCHLRVWALRVLAKYGSELPSPAHDDQTFDALVELVLL